jgi:uncharacterized protein (DUF1800 family)
MKSTWVEGATPPSKDLVTHILKRFTYGTTQQLVTDVRKVGVDNWFETQLDHLSISDAVVEAFISKHEMFNYIHKDINFLWPLAESEGDIAKGQIYNSNWMAGRILNLYTVIQQTHSNRQVFEMMVEFWHNHFNITTIGDDTKDGHLDWHTNDFNKKVIRQHALGKFEDMLQLSALHPAMIVSLDGELSTKELPNENYGRELLELHTVAPKSGYTQADILDAAKLFSGLRVKWPERYYQRGKKPRLEGRNTFIDISSVESMIHSERQIYGTFKVMGWQRTVNSPAEVLPAIQSLLSYLTSHPETAKTVALKLGRRFVEDVPSKKFIDDISSTFTSSKGDIKTVLRAVYRHPEFESAIGTKLKRSGEEYVSVARALNVWPNFSNLGVWKGITKDFPFVSPIIQSDLSRLGQIPLGWPFPDGYPDVATNWVNANSQILRWNTYGNFLQGSSWNQPDLGKLFPVAGKDIDSYIDGIARTLLQTDLGSADRRSIKNAVTKAFGSNVNLEANLKEKTSLIVRLVLQLPVWSLR